MIEEKEKDNHLGFKVLMAAIVGHTFWGFSFAGCCAYVCTSKP